MSDDLGRDLRRAARPDDRRWWTDEDWDDYADELRSQPPTGRKPPADAFGARANGPAPEPKRAEAVAEGEQAYAAALRVGKADPGRKAEESVVAELEAERRRAGALAVVGRDAQRDLVALVHAEAASLRAPLDQDAARVHEDYRRAVEAVATARARIDSVQSVVRWLTTLLDTGRSVTVGRSVVPRCSSPSGPTPTRR